MCLHMYGISFVFSLSMTDTMNFSSVLSVVLDFYSAVFLSVVLLISASVFKFSADYMGFDKFSLFFAMEVLAFVASMVVLICSNSFMTMFFGWDGLGFSSYALVMYYSSESSCKAGTITFLSNRVGDCAILLSLSGMSIFMGVGVFVFFCSSGVPMESYQVLLILAAMTKSAQVPFSAWLPAAMAAPTPVSSLVHSSTLVTAGAYLMIRYSDWMSGSLVLFMLGSLTSFISAFMANFEFNLKKVIAFSTLNQIGFIFLAVGVGSSSLAFFHLLMHALFKALLFISAGVVISVGGGSQDIRSMGGVGMVYPYTLGHLFLAVVSLMGLPFLTGFYSKDVIIEISMMGVLTMSSWLFIFPSLILGFSYSVRLLYYMLHFFSLSGSLGVFHDGWSMNSKSLFYLGMFSIVGGSIGSWVQDPVLSLVVFNELWWWVLLLCGGVVAIMGYTQGVIVNMSLSKSIFFLSSVPMELFFILSTYLWSFQRSLDAGWSEVLVFSSSSSLLNFFNFFDSFYTSIKYSILGLSVVVVLCSFV